jgi:nitrogen PTS system EIIA component
MRMSHFVVRDAVNPALAATTRDEAVAEMVAGLQAAGQFVGTDTADIVKAVLRREQLGSTGIGRGIAIPHSRHAAVSQLVGTVAVSKTGVPFDSIDGEPVHVFVMLISPQDRPGDHLRALENVVQTMRDDAFVAAVKAATTKEQLWELIGGSGPAY